jgi:hypothetical protein
MRTSRGNRRIFLAWAASAAAYTGFWAYHTAAYGLWYSGPVPWWLSAGLGVTLLAAVVITFALWWRLGKALR